VLSCILILFVMLFFFGNPWDDFLFILVIFCLNAGLFFFNMLNPKGKLLDTAAMALWTLGASLVTSVVSWAVGFLLYFTRLWELLIAGGYKLIFGKSLSIGVFYNADPISGFMIFLGILYLAWLIRNIYMFIRFCRW